MVMERQGNRRHPGARLHLASLGLLCVCTSLAAETEVATYRVDLAADLSEVWVEAKLPEDARSLSARDGEARLLADLAGCRNEPVQIRAGRIDTAAADGCVRYRYPLTPQSGRRSPPVDGGVRVTTPGAWLWLPALNPGERVVVAIESGQATALSVPWRPLGDGRFEIRPSPGSATGTAAFGDFPALTLRSGGATLRVAALDGPGLAIDREKLLDWLSVAADDVAGVSGRFPNPDVQVIVQAVRSRGRSPVPFGYVIRDGGEAVRFYVDPDRAIEDYHADWTATHEFAHLLLPYVRSREKWVSEGFASYYQNVLLARRGAYGQAEVWQRLNRSFRRAADVDRPPRLDRLHERSFRDVRMLVYWSGAALALDADVRLRAMGETDGLDGVLGRLADCCLPSGRVWTAAELFAQLDEFTPEPVFMPLYEDYMARRGMPVLEQLYVDLGIAADGDAVTLLPEGRLLHVRDAIMRPN